MTLATVLVCDKCQAKGPIRETDRETTDAGKDVGWAIVKIPPSGNQQGKAALDVCPRCIEGGLQTESREPRNKLEPKA